MVPTTTSKNSPSETTITRKPLPLLAQLYHSTDLIIIRKNLYKHPLKTRFKFTNSSLGPKFADYEDIS